MSYEEQDAVLHLIEHVERGISNPNCELCAMREENERTAKGDAKS